MAASEVTRAGVMPADRAVRVTAVTTESTESTESTQSTESTESPDWDVSGTLQDLQLYYEVGLGIANSKRWPNWYPGGEFRAIRDEGRK